MGYVLLVLILIIAILLGAVILVQNPKGTGLASGFESAGKIGGVQRTTDFLEKSTWYLTCRPVHSLYRSHRSVFCRFGQREWI